MDRWTVAKLVPAEWWAWRWVRWTVVITVWVVVYGAAAMFWHFVLDHSWADAIVFAVVLAVCNAVAQWWVWRTTRQKTSRRLG
ncbi:hypothetical protein AB0I66_37625 [Streptomyces sp. NPDC050439]|uniref:hypothetical protein n=1 Tax=unclassified Streptomyces TaxID=2593676 RepID=UPI00342FC59B